MSPGLKPSLFPLPLLLILYEGSLLVVFLHCCRVAAPSTMSSFHRSYDVSWMLPTTSWPPAASHGQVVASCSQAVARHSRPIASSSPPSAAVAGRNLLECAPTTLHHQGRAFEPVNALFDVDKTLAFHFIALMSSILVHIYITISYVIYTCS